MKKNNKGIILLLVTVLVCTMALAGCGEVQLSETINIATLNGPTGMGMAKLMENPDDYNVTTYQSPDEIVAKIVSGEVDLATVPSNLAAVLYNKTKGKIVSVSAVTLGVLYVLENGKTISDISQLKGKTIVASGKGGTPEYVLEKILKENDLKLGKDVKVEWLANHTEVVGKLLSKEGTIAMVPEPFVTVAKAKGGQGINQVLDMNKEWKTSTGQDLPMGVLIAQNSFVNDRKADLEIFLADYSESVKFVNKEPAEAATLIAKHGLVGDEKIAEKAIPNCNIVMYQKGESTELQKSFLDILYKMNPQAVGGKLPGEEFYY
ncbi:MAG: ABC transporter substrate-binding protein [Anaerovoracaceae bacterium]